jgi:hypothetical protein
VQTSIWVDVQQLSSVSAAKRFIAGGRTRAPGAGWTRQSYDLGDESTLSEHVSGQHQVSFRFGLFVGSVSGRELPRVERIARIIVHYLATFLPRFRSSGRERTTSSPVLSCLP